MQGERTLAGRYEVGRRIGRGGMAEVYLGVDERLGRRVAVKLLNTQLAVEPSFRSRFRQEAQSAARMTHPTIVRIFDAGEDTFVRGDGHEITVPYIVMEYVEGKQLRDLILEGALSGEQVVSYMSGILTALEYSHRAGIVHRDIKPGNVMITPQDEVKVMDFGIARAISDTAGTIAQTTAILGTASYFSPEQARGEQVDGRSDLYSAGIVLYEMLTGRVPFQGDSAVAVAYQHVTERPVPPSSVNPSVSPAFDAVVLRALAKHREERFQSASEFRRALQLAATGVVPDFTAPAERNEQRTELFGPAPTAIDRTETAFAALTESDDRAPVVQRRPPALWIWGAATLVLVIVVAVAIWVANLSQEPPVTATTVVVPDVSGTSWEQAESELRELGLDPQRENRQSDTVPVEEVIDTTPPAGLTVPEGQVITVLVSAGPTSVAVPDIQGMTVGQAATALEAAGLQLGSISSEDSASVLKDTVIRPDPPIGSQLAAGGTVDLVTSTGEVQLPDVRSLPLQEASSALTAIGLSPLTAPDPQCPAVEGQPVVNMSQTPGPVPQHSNITITYCDGEPEELEPTPTPTPTPTASSTSPAPTASAG